MRSLGRPSPWTGLNILLGDLRCQTGCPCVQAGSACTMLGCPGPFLPYRRPRLVCRPPRGGDSENGISFHRPSTIAIRPRRHQGMLPVSQAPSTLRRAAERFQGVTRVAPPRPRLAPQPYRPPLFACAKQDCARAGTKGPPLRRMRVYRRSGFPTQDRGTGGVEDLEGRVDDMGGTLVVEPGIHGPPVNGVGPIGPVPFQVLEFLLPH